jgi:hypothetical protein
MPTCKAPIPAGLRPEKPAIRCAREKGHGPEEGSSVNFHRAEVAGTGEQVSPDVYYWPVVDEGEGA